MNGKFLKNRLYGLLCEFEKNGTWEAYLDSILVELMGIEESKRSDIYYELFANISSLKFLRHKFFRKTIFACIALTEKMI